MLQDAVQVFSKNNELPKQHVTVSKPDVALEESGNSAKISPSVPVTDDRTNPTLQPGVYEQEERGTGGNFPQGYMPFPQAQMNFPQGQELNP